MGIEWEEEGRRKKGKGGGIPKSSPWTIPRRWRVLFCVREAQMPACIARCSDPAITVLLCVLLARAPV